MLGQYPSTGTTCGAPGYSGGFDASRAWGNPLALVNNQSFFIHSRSYFKLMSCIRVTPGLHIQFDVYHICTVELLDGKLRNNRLRHWKPGRIVGHTHCVFWKRYWLARFRCWSELKCSHLPSSTDVCDQLQPVSNSQCDAHFLRISDTHCI